MSNNTLSAFIGACAFYIVYKLYEQRSRFSLIAKIRGPSSNSFLFGNLEELLKSQAGEAEVKWAGAYGDIVRFKASFGEDRLLISDPKALQYVMQTAGYNFAKQPERRELSRVHSGRGLASVDADDHKRHRKIMNPAFATSEIKKMLPVFFHHAEKLTVKWKELVGASPDQSVILDMPSWTSRATLDAIGEAAFDYNFGVLDSEDNALGKAYTNLFADTFGFLTNGEILTQSILQHLPSWLRTYIIDHAPSKKLEHVRHTSKLAIGIAKNLVDMKSQAVLKGQVGRDVMSILIKANNSEVPGHGLNEEEMISQMRTLIMAGHETTANSVSWTLLELARHPEVQKKLRKEIRETERLIIDRGDSAFTTNDMDSMTYLNAVLKESMRYDNVAYNMSRAAMKDDILPLSKPITTIDGQVLTEIPIPKGLRVLASITVYHRNKAVFGDDADVFRPERWLDGTVKKSTNVGVYANLLAFAAGVRSCIGWRFAVVEMQALIVEIVNNFEFFTTPESDKVRKEACLVMVPTIEGQVEKGQQLPLIVKVASKDEE